MTFSIDQSQLYDRYVQTSGESVTEHSAHICLSRHPTRPLPSIDVSRIATALFYCQFGAETTSCVTTAS